MWSSWHARTVFLVLLSFSASLWYHHNHQQHQDGSIGPRTPRLRSETANARRRATFRRRPALVRLYRRTVNGIVDFLCTSDMFVLECGAGPSPASTRPPTRAPTPRPTRAPTPRPTRAPTKAPPPTSRAPTSALKTSTGDNNKQVPTTKAPTTRQPTNRPTKRPTRQPTRRPANQRTRQPTNRPTNRPTRRPTKRPTRRPTPRPTRQPTNRPTRKPTRRPTPKPTEALLSTSTIVQNVGFKLYWEDGYMWQGSRKEKKWCAAYNYNGGTCYYNNRNKRDCNPDHLYIAGCDSNAKGQQFNVDQVHVPDGRQDVVQIRTATRKCWEYSGNTALVELEACDAANKKQQWITKNGSVQSKNFELVPMAQASECVTQHHHPKAGEVLELVRCSVPRQQSQRTSFWNLYYG